MRKRLNTILLMMMAFCTFLATPAMAGVYASDQLSSYSVAATTTSDGKIAVKVSVTGTGKMNCLGAEKIYFYEQSANGNWIALGFYDRNDLDMCSTNTYHHGSTVYYPAEAGKSYRVIVTIFAEDDAGYDSRVLTRYT